jgi:hypothetical protein
MVGGKRMNGPFDTFAGLSPQQKSENAPEEKWLSSSCINCLAAIPSGQGHDGYGKWLKTTTAKPKAVQ